MEPNIQYIDNQESFLNAVAVLSNKKEIFIDLEFDKNHFRYGFNLCLMQIFDGETCFLIDPLSDLTIEKIFPVLEDENIQIVCFAFSEDLRLFYHLGARPNNILDLAIATRLLDYDTLSLNNTLSIILEDEIYATGKSSQQKSNWFQRPLTDQQKLYAAEDVLYLPALNEKLKHRIEEVQKTDWLQQEMNAFESYDWSSGAVAEYLTKKDQKQLSLREWIRFQKIMEYREKIAASLNRPTYKVLDKNIVFDLAKSPGKVKQWTSLKGVHPKFRTEQIQAKITVLLDAAEQEISEHKITMGQSSIPLLSREEGQEMSQRRKHQQYFKESFFLPIKEVVKTGYGENFSNYFLSNRKITDFINKDQLLLSYQKEIITNAAKQLNLSLPQFISDSK
jgi:ribonuclease D